MKLYAWEWAFTSRIDEMRNDELQYIYRSKIVNGSLVAILTSIPVFVRSLHRLSAQFKIYLSDSNRRSCHVHRVASSTRRRNGVRRRHARLARQRVADQHSRRPVGVRSIAHRLSTSRRISGERGRRRDVGRVDRTNATGTGRREDSRRRENRRRKF